MAGSISMALQQNKDEAARGVNKAAEIDCGLSIVDCPPATTVPATPGVGPAGGAAGSGVGPLGADAPDCSLAVDVSAERPLEALVCQACNCSSLLRFQGGQVGS